MFSLSPPPGARIEAAKAGLDARRARVEERSVVGTHVSTAEVRPTPQTAPDGRPNPAAGGGIGLGLDGNPGFPLRKAGGKPRGKAIWR